MNCCFAFDYPQYSSPINCPVPRVHFAMNPAARVLKSLFCRFVLSSSTGLGLYGFHIQRAARGNYSGLSWMSDAYTIATIQQYTNVDPFGNVRFCR